MTSRILVDTGFRGVPVSQEFNSAGALFTNVTKTRTKHTRKEDLASMAEYLNTYHVTSSHA
jgi:hypothetical protein